MAIVNPYVYQIMQQTAMTESEVRKASRPTVSTHLAAQARGYESAEAYEEALHDFLNSN